MKSFTIHDLRFTICMLIGCLCVLTSCRRDIVYSQFQSISTESWHADSVVHFDYAITDAEAAYGILIYIRHTERYPYQNMWLFVNDGVARDTLEFYLADDRGRWLGDKHHGFIEMPVLLEQAKHFADTGRYSMEIAHGMRDSLLRGVTDVGVEVIKVEN